MCVNWFCPARRFESKLHILVCAAETRLKVEDAEIFSKRVVICHNLRWQNSLFIVMITKEGFLKGANKWHVRGSLALDTLAAQYLGDEEFIFFLSVSCNTFRMFKKMKEERAKDESEGWAARESEDGRRQGKDHPEEGRRSREEFTKWEEYYTKKYMYNKIYKQEALDEG